MLEQTLVPSAPGPRAKTLHALTTQDDSHVETRIFLCERLPCANDTIGRVDQGAIHVKKAANNVFDKSRC